ncbi:MAG: CBS domain-containing protein [Motiliproteus sp.]|nr:CBS domain-containing protein [Motiliproteus sp.]
MALVADIMTAKVAYIEDSASLREARNVMKELSVRHLPVVDGNGGMAGILSQRVILAEVIKLVDQVGVAKLEEAEGNISIRDIMQTDFQVIHSGADLKLAGKYFLEHKHSCLPVVDQGALVGIVTSQDFVKLCVKLL